MISQLHGTEIWGNVPPHHLRALAQSDLILCVSRDTEARIHHARPDLQNRTFVLPNTVHPRFSPGDRMQARKTYGFGKEKVILTVGRLDSRGGYKGHDRVLRLLPELSKDHDGEVCYLIAGEGEDRGRLEALASELDVSHLTRFLGRIDNEKLPDLYRAADVFAMPSTGEGFGIVYLEAMACGTPAIGIDVGGVRDAFDQGNVEGCVAPERFEMTLKQFLSRTPPDRATLAARIADKYGPKTFLSRLNTGLQAHGIVYG